MTFEDAKILKRAAVRLREKQPKLSRKIEGIVDKLMSQQNTLQDVFDEQIRLNTRIRTDVYDRADSDDDYRKQCMIEFNLAMQQEQAELIDSLDWKWWKKGENNWDNAKVELVDILHFWVSMCTIVGMNANDVMDLYFKKNKLNHKRQDGGYKEGTYQKVVDGVEDNVREVTHG